MTLQAEHRARQRDLQRILDAAPDDGAAGPLREIDLASLVSPDEIGDGIVAALDRMTGIGLDQDLRHLAGQVARQASLPRSDSRDGRFLKHLEWALRDLATRPVEPRTAGKTGSHLSLSQEKNRGA